MTIEQIEDKAAKVALMQWMMKTRSMSYQVDAKLEVANHYGLSWDEVNLPYTEWAELRERYKRETGNKL